MAKNNLPTLLNPTNYEMARTICPSLAFSKTL